MIGKPDIDEAGLDKTRLLSFLEGEWKLERRASNGAWFQGTASFERQEDNSLLLREVGKVQLPDQTVMNAGREWVWLVDTTAKAPAVQIFYPPERGGELYHDLVFTAEGERWLAHGVHHCGDDVYTAKYQISPEDITIDHVIKGPAKDMEVSARYFKFQ